MSAPDLSEQIQALRVLRLDCAARSQVLSERDLDARVLRAKLEEELVSKHGIARTRAEKLVKEHVDYLEHEQESIRLVFERERVLAEAEATLLNVKLQLAVLERVGP